MNLSTLPDPTKPVWEQDVKILETLMWSEKKLREEAERAAKREREGG